MKIVNYDVLFCRRTSGTAVFRDRVQSLYLHALLSGFCAITTRDKRASVRDSECSGLGDAEEASVMFERYRSRTAAASVTISSLLTVLVFESSEEKGRSYA